MEEYIVEPTASPYDEELYPFVKNQDNSYSNVKSQISERDGIFYIEPTMGDTSKHFGGYSTLESASAAEKEMHKKLEDTARNKSFENINDWEETPIQKFEDINDWETQPVNIPSYNIQDLDTGENIIAPATMDIVDVKFNNATQTKNRNKNDFWGKVDILGDSGAEVFNDVTAGVVGFAGGLADTFLHKAYNIPKLEKEYQEQMEKGDVENAMVTAQRIAHVNGIREKNQKYISKIQEVLSPKEQRDSVDDFLIAFGNAAPFSGLSIGTAFMTGNPALTAGLMGVLSGRMRYTELFDKAIAGKLDYETADWFAELGGWIEGSIDAAGDYVFLKAIKAIPFKKVFQSLAKENDTLVKAGKKIVNKESVGLGFVKGGGIEFGSEELQNTLGALWETAVDDSPIDWGEITMQSLAAGLSGGLGGVYSTSKYNSVIDKFNDSFKTQVKALDPTMSDTEAQKIANAGQELLFQVSESVAGQLDNLASKQIEPDNLPEKNLNMSKQVRDIVKERYKLSDEDVDKIATVATRALNIRNEFNQAQQYFYDKLVEVGMEAPQAASVAKVYAAQAASNAIAEGISVKEAIDTQGFKFTKAEVQAMEDMGGESGKLFNAAMTNSKFYNFADFYNNVRENKSSSRKEQFNIVTRNGVPLRIIHDVVNHDYNNHVLTVDEWETLFQNMDKVEMGATSQKKPRFSGKPIVLKVKAKDKFYGVALELFENKNPIITTAFIDKEGSIDNWIKNEISPSGTKNLTFLGTNLNDIIYDIFPNFKKNVINGARRYSRDTGEVKGYYDPTTKEIGLTENADVSTALHEGMHGFEDNLRQRANNGSEVAKKQIEAMRDYVGAESTDFTTEQSEQIARAFERYALDGKAPNKTLKDAFDRFSHWLKNIYNTGEQLGVVSPELGKAFREMLGGRKLDTALQLGELIMNEKVKEGKISKKDIGNKIKRLLNFSKPRTVNGKLVGRFPDKSVNDFFTDARNTLSTKKDVAVQKIAQNLGDIQMLNDTGEFALEDGRDVDDLIWENKLLSIAANRADTSLMAEVYNSMMNTYNEGRVGEKVKKEARKERMEHLRNDAKSVILQGKGENWRNESSKLVQAGRRFGLMYQGWNGILDTLSIFDKTSKTGESLLNKDLSVYQEETNSRWGVYQDAEKLGGYLSKALGTGKSVSKYVNSTAKEKIRIEWGENSKLFTKGQLIDLYMKSKDPETRKIMVEDDVLQYNEEFLARLEENLTDDDVKVADALFEFYRDNYNKVNDFYEKRYGISLGHKEFYSPRSMQSQAIDVRGGDLISGAAVSSFKQRTAKKGQIAAKDAFAIANDYINSTNHYIAFADKLSELNAVFQGDPTIRNAISNIFGNKMNKTISKEISRFATNNQKFLDAYDGIVRKVRSNYVASVLGGRPSITIKQLISFPAYLEKMSVPEFVKGVSEFAAHPLEAMKIIGETDYMKTRGFDINQDFQKISKSEALKKFTTRKGFKDFLMMNVQIGDRGAIYIGGYALYKSELGKNLAKGMTESEAKKKALEAVNKFTNETQQSSYMSEQSALQSNPYTNLFTMFQTSQNQYLRKELGAIRGLATGRMGLKDAAKVISIYHFLLPMLFQYISDFGRWDWDNQKRAGILGSFNGAFILSSILETGANWLVTGKLNRHDTRLQDVIPVWSVVEESSKFGEDIVDLDYNDITLEDVGDVLKQGAKTGGMLAGVPAKWLIDMGTIPDYIEDKEYSKALGALLGWTPYALNKD